MDNQNKYSGSVYIFGLAFILGIIFLGAILNITSGTVLLIVTAFLMFGLALTLILTEYRKTSIFRVNDELILQGDPILEHKYSKKPKVELIPVTVRNLDTKNNCYILIDRRNFKILRLKFKYQYRLKKDTKLISA